MVTNELLDRFAEAIIEVYRQDHITEGNQAIDDIGDNCDDCMEAAEASMDHGPGHVDEIWCERHKLELPGLLIDEPSDDDKDLAKLALVQARNDLAEAMQSSPMKCELCDEPLGSEPLGEAYIYCREHHDH